MILVLRLISRPETAVFNLDLDLISSWYLFQSSCISGPGLPVCSWSQCGTFHSS